MSDLTFLERSKLERLFGMGSGYVLGFSNRTFQEFIADSARRDIYDQKYAYSSGSKANLLRRFWEVEPNHVVGKVIGDLIDLAEEGSQLRGAENLVRECRHIAERLLQGAPVQELDAIGDQLDEKDLDLLVKSIRSSIDDNEPEAGLDRLHTFVTKFLRHVCRGHGIDATEGKPLHSLLGEYIKKMKAEGGIETLMTERILKSSISTLEAFNTVRNDHSFAHDNPVLNHEESLFIFNHVTSAVRFIQALERKLGPKPDASDSVDDEIPF